MNKIWQFVLTLLVEKGFKLAKELIEKMIADMKARKRVKDCANEDDPVKRSECFKRELDND